jgi:hypothetical protein
MFFSGLRFALFTGLFTGHGFLRGGGIITPITGGHGVRMHGMYFILAGFIITVIAQ